MQLISQTDKTSGSANENHNLAQALIKNQVPLKQFIRRSVQQESDVEDIFQKVLLKGLKRKNENVVQNPLSYGFKMAENVIAEHYREHLQQPEEMISEPPCEKIDLERQLEYRQRLALYQKVLANMPELRQKVFIRSKFHGHSRQEIARSLSLSEEAVKKHVSRALDDLKVAVERSLRNAH